MPEVRVHEAEIFKQERNTTMSAGKVFLGFMIAISAGAVLGVLFAPDKGVITRKKLSKQGTRYMDAAKKAASDAAETIEETLETVGETAAGITDKVKDAVDSFAR